MNTEHEALGQLLADAMHQEVERTMTTTNTPKELARLEERLGRRKSRYQLVAAAAAVLVIVATGVGVVAVRSHRSTQPHPAATQPSPTSAPTPAASAPVALLAEPSALPASVVVNKAAGPGTLGLDALGSVWATRELSAPQGQLYRLDSTGAVVSDTPYAGYDKDDPAPFQAGQHVLLASTPASGSSSFLVFDANGTLVGSIPARGPAGGVGDTTGAWAQSDYDALIRVDATGLHVAQTITLPNISIVGMTAGGGSIFVLDELTNSVLRIDPATSTVTGTTPLPANAQVFEIAYDNGAVYVSSQDYELRRIDATTMKMTAEVSSHDGDAWVEMTVTSTGDLWATASQGVIDKLDPTTLATERAIQLFPSVRSGGNFGAVVTSDRAYLADGDNNVVWSFPLG